MSTTDPHQGAITRPAYLVLADFVRQVHAQARIIDADNKAGDAEVVHDLRVAIRRLAAALRVYAEATPDDLAQKLHRKTRKLRRISSELRDWDVLVADVGSSRLATPSTALARAAIARRVAARRPKLWRRLRRQIRRLEGDGFWAWADKHLSRLGSKASTCAAASIHEMAQKRKAASAANLRRYLRAARAGDDAALHLARLAAKDLRYSFDVASAATGGRAAADHRLYAAVQLLQDRLGVLQDARIMAERCAALAADAALSGPCRASFARLVDRYRRRRRRCLQALWADPATLRLMAAARRAPD